MKITAREVALNTLAACDRQGAWSNSALKKAIHEAELDARDAALASQLCYGVLQNRARCDFYIQHFSKMPLKRMETRVLEILRLGAYQLVFLERIPVSAAVNTSVDLARKYAKNPRAAGMVNGILRSLSRALAQLPELPVGQGADQLAIRYSHPRWLVELFLQEIGADETERLLCANNQRPPITAQVNRLKTTTNVLQAALEQTGMTVQRHPWLPDCLILDDTGDLETLDAWQSGMFYIQDPAARLAVEAAKPLEGQRVLDACAAPGGKSFAAAIAMRGRGTILSCDLHPHKIKLIEAGANRLGLGLIEPQCQDASQHRPEWDASFDLVLADVPCSGLGVIRKKPDIRYKAPDQLEQLPEIQQAILENVSTYVKPGGVLLYATCTVRSCENGQVVDAFLKRHPEYLAEAFTLPAPIGEVTSGRLTLWPHIHDTDGFFIAKLRRTAN